MGPGEEILRGRSTASDDSLWGENVPTGPFGSSPSTYIITPVDPGTWSGDRAGVIGGRQPGGFSRCTKSKPVRGSGLSVRDVGENPPDSSHIFIQTNSGWGDGTSRIECN